MKRVKRILKGLLASYIVTGIFLLILAFVLYKISPPEGVIKVGILFSYIISPLLGGFFLGKGENSKKFIWGALLGGIYFCVIFIISLILSPSLFERAGTVLSVLGMCGFGGMLGGMIS
ncbi:MAG: TIGR04086 family membrane protein [Acetivibrio sp.]